MPRLFVAVLAVAFLARPAAAQTYSWSGLGADNLWSTAANWQGGIAPVSNVNTAVVLGGTTKTSTVLNLGGFQLNSLTFAADAGPFTIGQSNGDYFNFFPTGGGTAPVINQFSSAGQTINLPTTGIQLNGDLVLGGTGTGGLTIVGAIISPTAPGRLILTGPYPVTLNGSNQSAGLTVNAGILRLVRLSDNFGAGPLVFGGGTLQLINNLGISTSVVVNAGGGTIDANGYAASMNFSHTVTGAGRLTFTNTAAGPGGATISGQLQQTGGLLVTGANDTVTLRGADTYSGPTLLNGGATLAIDADSRLGNTSGTTFDNGTLALVYPSGFTTARPFTLGPGGGTFSIDPTVAPTTFNGPIGGSGGLTKTGAGTITLAGSNSYSGGTAVLGGTLAVNSDAALGTGNVTGGPLGTLQFNFNSPGQTATSKSFAMNGGTILVSAGETVTFDGGTVSGATLDGTGAVTTGATNGDRFVNVTTTPVVTIDSASPADQFVHFTNKGTLTVAANVNVNGTSTIANLNGFTNQGLGNITVGAGSRIGVANFQSDGTLTLSPAPVGTGEITLLTNVGAGPLGFNGGSRTFVGSPQTAGQKAGIDLHGQNAVVAGGLFVNNGFITDSTNSGATIIADYGALVKGAGTYQNSVITQNGGKFQAGNSPGKATFGQLVLGPGGTQNFNWQINNATGVAGPSPDQNNQVSGWSLLSAEKIVDPLSGMTSSGDLTWTATSVPGHQFNLSLQTLVNPTTVGQDVQGAMANFNGFNPPTGGYVWRLVQWQGTYTGPTTDTALMATVLLDTSNFVNPVNGMGDPDFRLFYNGAAKEIDLFYGVPEPGALALLAFAAVPVIGRGLKRRRQPKSPN